MNSPLPPSSTDSLARSNYGDQPTCRRSTVSWGAIFAGTSSALALQALFLMLGAGLGFAIYSPLTDDSPVANLSIGALVIHSICAIIALWFGGWVAGRFSPVNARSTGWLHGFCVWCAATVGGVALVALGAGVMLGGISKIVGGSATSVAGGAADLAANAVEQSGDTIASFVDEAVSNLPEDGPAGENIRATREIGLALARLFNPAQEENADANRAAAVTALVDHTEMSQAEAESAVAEWTSTFEGLKDDLAAIKESAAEQAREAADATADALATISLWTFFGFLLGALAASWGGHHGSICATKHEEAIEVGLSDHRQIGLSKRQASDIKT